MKKLLLFLISLCGVLNGCQRMPSKPVTFTPTDSIRPSNILPDTVPPPDTSHIRKPDPPEYKLLYGVPPTPYERKQMAEDSLKNAKE